MKKKMSKKKKASKGVNITVKLGDEATSYAAAEPSKVAVSKKFKEAVEERSPVREGKKLKKRKRDSIDPSFAGESSKSKKDQSTLGKKLKDEADSKHDLTVKCRPSSLSTLIPLLSNEQRIAIEEIGFGGLLYIQDFAYLSWHHMYWFFEHFNPVSRMLCFANNEKFVVTPFDVCDAFLLPMNEGRVVLRGKDEPFLKSFMKNWVNLYSEKNIVSCSGLRNLLLDASFSGGGDDFKRFFILYSMSVFLAPTMNGSTNLYLLKSIVEVNLISTLDWSSYVLDRLCRAMSYLKDRPSNKYVSGCCLILPLLYFHRLKWKGLAVSSSFPLIRHWNSKSINKRLLEELKAGGFGQGEFVVGVYLISQVNQNEAASPQRVRTRNDGTDMSGTYVRYSLPAGEKTDAEIKHIAADALEDSFLLLKRDLNIVSHAHMDRLRDLSKFFQRRGKPEEVPSSSKDAGTSNDDFFGSDKFCMLVDEVVVNFKALQEESKVSYSCFPGVRAASPLFEVNEAAVADVIADLCKGDASSLSAGFGFDNIEKEVEEGHEVGDEAALDLTQATVEDCGKMPAEVDKGFAEVAVVHGEKIEEAGGLDEDIFVCGEGISSVGPNGSQYLDSDPIDPWFVALDEWIVDENVGFQSAFMKKNERYLKGLSTKDKYVVDFFFHKHRAKIDSNVFSCRVEKHNARAEERGQSKIFFTAQHSLHACELLKLKKALESWSASEIDSDRVSAVEFKSKLLRGSWKFSLDRMGSVKGMSTAELIFIPVHSDSHFYLVVVDFRERIIHHLDNLKHTSEENSTYWQLTCLLRDEFSIFLEEIKHPKASEVKSYKVASVQFEWNKHTGGFDCGVFVMRHMEMFEGKAYSCPDLEKPAGRRKLRALYCAQIAVAGTNDLRFEVYKMVLAFMNRKKK